MNREINTRDLGSKELEIDLYYPRLDHNGDTIRVSLLDVRAANDLMIRYDFDRDGWVIGSDFLDPDSEDGLDDTYRSFNEVAFIPAWPTKERTDVF